MPAIGSTRVFNGVTKRWDGKKWVATVGGYSPYVGKVPRMQTAERMQKVPRMEKMSRR